MPSNVEIKTYVDEVVQKYGLQHKMRLSTEVTGAVWMEDVSQWMIYLKDTISGKEYCHSCKAFFAASGQLVEPRPCDIQGSENFLGSIFHSARWNHDISLEGKNVVIIGNGCKSVPQYT